jgi:hypothetical protein
MNLQVIALIILLVMAVLGTIFMPRYWRNPSRFYRRVSPQWWTYGDAFWRGFVRSLLASIIAGWFLVLGGFGIFLANGKTIDQAVPVWLGLGFFAFGFISLSIAFFNWPKFLVPPSLRDQPGAVQEWLRHRRPRDKPLR